MYTGIKSKRDTDHLRSGSILQYNVMYRLCVNRSANLDCFCNFFALCGAVSLIKKNQGVRSKFQKKNRPSRNAFPVKELKNILKKFPRYARNAFPLKELKNIP